MTMFKIEWHYKDDKLVGGLYGLSLGSVFFGESMFFNEPDASKIALVHLVARVKEWGFHLIDAQVETDHLKRMGAQTIDRKTFLKQLSNALQHPANKGKW